MEWAKKGLIKGGKNEEKKHKIRIKNGDKKEEISIKKNKKDKTDIK